MKLYFDNEGYGCSSNFPFKINDIDADIADFGIYEDWGDPNDKLFYSCTNRYFSPYIMNNYGKLEPTLDKYDICEEDYITIQQLLESILYRGSCGDCN